MLGRIDLPAEAFKEIISYLDEKDFRNLNIINKRHNTFMKNHSTYTILCKLNENKKMLPRYKDDLKFSPWSLDLCQTRAGAKATACTLGGALFSSAFVGRILPYLFPKYVPRLFYGDEPLFNLKTWMKGGLVAVLGLGILGLAFESAQKASRLARKQLDDTEAEIKKLKEEFRGAAKVPRL